MARYFIHRPVRPVLAIIVSLVIPILLLSGCISHRYRRPNVSVPPSFRGDGQASGVPDAPHNGQTGSLGELRWQDLIHDEELSKLIREALAHNFDAEVAAARVLEAGPQLTIARSARLPSVAAQAGYNNLRTAEDISGPLPEIGRASCR